MSAILIQDLHKHYGSVRALDGLSLKVEEGTVFGFLGPNGAGKSTTLRILTGLARPTSGSAQIAGIDVVARDHLSAKIGYLPEDPTFYGWMTPLEFMDYAARLFGLGAAERRKRITELLEMAGLADVGKRRIRGFSRGMRQRLGLAQALINKPEVLLLDEPASALDPAGRRDVLSLIAGLKSSSTVFMSTHILEDVERICDSVAIINKGKLVTEARQDELLSSYTIPAFILEAEPDAGEQLNQWLKTLGGSVWFASMNMDGTIARVTVNDLQAARHALLAGAAAANVPLSRFEIVKPSLEDVFLRLVGQEVQQ
jgi:ABC-2 type transport system ATP-binding protein